ncbi:hypothetical protein K458DRAFT_84806 [Lentithecium fluviatile CBS 122367]|uniref:Uncharacterized protein n=1 Tax=Lentithecium fluviatile CBS 122367 TaxID=1168545 RepID=A0A6G1IS59_9PLEO|nr:hypothetical protein K458DRAFT_84806 [Lentithecium fluviatile CBS 122367]
MKNLPEIALEVSADLASSTIKSELSFVEISIVYLRSGAGGTVHRSGERTHSHHHRVGPIDLGIPSAPAMHLVGLPKCLAPKGAAADHTTVASCFVYFLPPPVHFLYLGLAMAAPKVFRASYTTALSSPLVGSSLPIEGYAFRDQFGEHLTMG